MTHKRFCASALQVCLGIAMGVICGYFPSGFSGNQVKSLVIERQNSLQEARSDEATHVQPLPNVKEEIDRVRSEISEARRVRADAVFRLLKRFEIADVPPEEWRRMIVTLDEWDSPYICNMVRAQVQSGQHSEALITLQMALCSGGSEVASLIEELLKNPPSSVFYENTLNALGGIGGWLARLERLPVTSALEERVWEMSSTGTPAERMAAIGLLGNIRTERARIRILELYGSAESTQMKCALVWALGRQALEGSTETLERLQAELTIYPDEQRTQLEKWIGFALRSSQAPKVDNR